MGNGMHVVCIVKKVNLVNLRISSLTDEIKNILSIAHYVWFKVTSDLPGAWHVTPGPNFIALPNNQFCA